MLTRILIAELRYRPWTALLTVLITVCSVAMVLFFIGISELLATRTRLIQRDLGLNLRFIPADTNLDRYWLRGYAEGAIDESLVDRLASQEVANRLVPMSCKPCCRCRARSTKFARLNVTAKSRFRIQKNIFARSWSLYCREP